MTRDETKKILMVMTATYPNFKPADPKSTLDAWTVMLDEYSYEQVSLGLKAFVTTDTSGFAPSPGQLIGKIHAIFQPKELNEMEAWGLVRAAINNSGYNAAEEFEKLPPAVQKAVGGYGQLHEWALSDISYIESVAQSNFMRTYRSVCEREKEYGKFPADVKTVIDKVNRGMLDKMEERGIACSD